MHLLRILLQRILRWTQRSTTALWLIAAVCYLGVVTTNSLKSAVASRQQITDLETKLTNLESERDRLKALLVYYQSDSFKEKELRRVALLHRPEEKVYALPESSVGKQQAAHQALAAAQAARDPRRNLPNWEQWWRYIQGK